VDDVLTLIKVFEVLFFLSYLVFLILNLEQDLGKIDLIICLGGDGTLLHVSSIFQQSCPPVLSFSMGSLGFLTPFDFKFHEKILNEVLSGNVAVLLRTRLSCTIVKDESNDSPSSDVPRLSLESNGKIISNRLTMHAYHLIPMLI